MHRPRYLWCLLLTPVLFVLVVSAVGCGGAPEEPLVRKFFQASRLGDNMTLTNIATVHSTRPRTAAPRTCRSSSPAPSRHAR